MRPVDTAGMQNAEWRKVTFAKDQPEYRQLPALVPRQRVDPKDAIVRSEWRPSLSELVELLLGGTISLRMMTFGGAPQPVILTVSRRDPAREGVAEWLR